MIRFTKEEIELLEISFDMDSGDDTMRNDYMPEWLQQDYGYSRKKVEKLFKSIEEKFRKFHKEKK